MNRYDNNASVVLCRCRHSRELYGIRAEKCNADTWLFTWSFKIKETSAKREGYDSNYVSGQINHSDEFPGCPYCESHSWFQCGACGKLTCCLPDPQYTKCAWCGNEGECQTAEHFDISGIDY